MSKLHFLIPALLVLILAVRCEEPPTEFIISEDFKVETFESLTRTYKVLLGEAKQPFVLIRIFPVDPSNPSFVFVSRKQAMATNDKCDHKSSELRGFVFLPQSYYSARTELYVTVACEKNCNYQIAISYRQTYRLEDNSSFEVMIEPNINTQVLYDPKGDGKDFHLTIQSGEDESTMEVSYGDSKYNALNVLKNGHGVVISAKDYKYAAETPFIISFKGTKKTLYTIKHTLLPIKIVACREKVNVILDGVNQIKSCFTLAEVSPATLNESTPFILNALSYTRNAYVFITSQEGQEVKGTLIDSTGFLRFTANDLGLICVKQKEGFTQQVGIQFQILNENDLIKSQRFNAPLLRGSPIKGYLPAGGIMFYRLNIYPSYTQQYQTFFNFDMSQGDPLFYVGIVTTFPYIEITSEEIKKMYSRLMTPREINDHFYYINDKGYDNPHINPNQIGSMVQCPETSLNGCAFDVTIGIVKEVNDLVTDLKMYQPKAILESHFYQFDISDPSIESLKVYLYSFSGDAELKVSRDKYYVKDAGTYHSAGNREYYECTNQAQAGQPNTLVGKYHVRVEGRPFPAYYSIYYSTSKAGTLTAIDVPSGEVVTETINKKEGKKSFTFINRLTSTKVNYFATITALNCDISIMFAGKTHKDRHNTFLIKQDDPIYSSGRYTFEVILNMIDTQSQDQEENCLMYFSGDELVIDKEILLNEGLTHSMTLSESIKRIVYIYPLLYFNNDKLYINFSKEDEGKVKLTYTILNTGHPETAIISSANKKVYLYSEKISEKCQFGGLLICPIRITVELNEVIPGMTIDFSVGIASSNEIPSYLPKGVVKQDLIGIKETKYNYYYTDIKSKETGEIVLNFKRGSGLMVARIVPKNKVDKNPDWNKRVILPKSGYADNIPFDYFNKKIVFTEEHTKDCLEFGCELYVGVYIYEYLLAMIPEYSIFIRNDDTVVNLPENNLVFGSLSKTYKDDKEDEGEVDYFTVHIHTDTDRIILNLIGELCFGYAKVGKDKPNKQNAQWKFEGKSSMQEIKASDVSIASPSLLGQDITFAIGTRGLENIYSSFYSFKIISSLKSMPTVIEVSSSYNEMCDITSKNGQCYFIIPIDPYSQVMKICMNTLSDKAANSKFEIYTRYITAKVYDYLSPEEKISKFPTEVSSDKSSAAAFRTDYLCHTLEYQQHSVDSYLLVTVKSKEAGRVTFLSNYSLSPQQIYVKPNSKELFVIWQPSHLVIQGKENYYIEIVRLEGSALVSTPRENNLFINKEQKSLAIILNADGLKDVNIRPEVNGSSFYCYIQYLIRPKENFDEVKYGRPNPISYAIPSFPMIYYILVENEEDNIEVNVRFSVYNYKEGKNLGDDDFVVQGLVTDENFVIERKKDSTRQPEISSSITEPFNQALRLGRLTFSSKMIKQHITQAQKYLYVSIKPKDTNKHEYTQITAQVTAMPTNSVDRRIVLSSNQYFFAQIDKPKPTQFVFFKNDPIDEVMEIEFSLLDPLYRFSVNPIPDNDADAIDYTKNSTAFLAEKTKHGRNFIEVNVKENKKGISFIVYKPTNKLRALEEEPGNGNDRFAIKYQSAKYAPQHFLIQNNNLSWEASPDRNTFTILFESIINETGAVPQTDYYISYYASTNTSQLNSIYLKQEPVGVDKIERSIARELSLSSTKAPKDSFYFTVTAVAKINNTMEILLYEPQASFINKPKDPPGSSYVYYIVGGVVIALILIGLLVYYYVKYTKMNKKISKTDYEKINDAGPVIDDDRTTTH